MLIKILLGWAIFVAVVYFLMYADYFVHKYNVGKALRAFADSFGEE